jgi:hypothetical protein
VTESGQTAFWRSGCVGTRMSSTSARSTVMAGKDDVLYSIDYQRGIDILR